MLTPAYSQKFPHRSISSSTALSSVDESYLWKAKSWINEYTQPFIINPILWIDTNPLLPEMSTDQAQFSILDEIFLSEIEYGSKRIIIHSGLSLAVQISFEDGYYIAFSEKFGVYGFGNDRNEALDDFKESFVDFYCDVVETPESELGQSTLEYKNTLVSFAIIESL